MDEDHRKLARKHLDTARECLKRHRLSGPSRAVLTAILLAVEALTADPGAPREPQGPNDG